MLKVLSLNIAKEEALSEINMVLFFICCLSSEGYVFASLKMHRLCVAALGFGLNCRGSLDRSWQ